MAFIGKWAYLLTLLSIPYINCGNLSGGGLYSTGLPSTNKFIYTDIFTDSGDWSQVFHMFVYTTDIGKPARHFLNIPALSAHHLPASRQTGESCNDKKSNPCKSVKDTCRIPPAGYQLASLSYYKSRTGRKMTIDPRQKRCIPKDFKIIIPTTEKMTTKKISSIFGRAMPPVDYASLKKDHYGGSIHEEEHLEPNWKYVPKPPIVDDYYAEFLNVMALPEDDFIDSGAQYLIATV